MELRPLAGGLTVVTGENGSGKTSLLEAIAYAGSLRSMRDSPRESLVRIGAERAVVRLEAADGARRTLLEIELAPRGRDRVLRNRQRVGRVQELVETLRTTVFSPDDLEIVKGGPERRRALLDDVVVAARPGLASTRQVVERVLRQRNTLLKSAGGRLSADVAATLDVWDAQLAGAGTQLTEAREALLEEMGPAASAAFSQLAGTEAGLELSYRRSYEGDLGSALATGRTSDLRREATTVGPHRDELLISSAGLDARTRLSQGRQRCVTLALRLAAHEVVARHAGTTPVLLLDDAFSELDERTARALLEELPPGQAILTTAGGLPPGAKASGVVHLEGGRIVR